VGFLCRFNVPADFAMADHLLKEEKFNWPLAMAKMALLLFLDCLFLAVVVCTIKQLY
jgi:hypothetical protein